MKSERPTPRGTGLPNGGCGPPKRAGRAPPVAGHSGENGRPLAHFTAVHPSKAGPDGPKGGKKKTSGQYSLCTTDRLAQAGKNVAAVTFPSRDLSLLFSGSPCTGCPASY